MEQTQQLVMGPEAIQAIVQGLTSNEALVAAITDRVSARTSSTGMGLSTTPQPLPPAAPHANITLQDTAMTSSKPLDPCPLVATPTPPPPTPRVSSPAQGWNDKRPIP